MLASLRFAAEIGHIGKPDKYEFAVLTNLEEMRLIKDIIEKSLLHIPISDNEGDYVEIQSKAIERLEQEIKDIILSREN